MYIITLNFKQYFALALVLERQSLFLFGEIFNILPLVNCLIIEILSVFCQTLWDFCQISLNRITKYSDIGQLVKISSRVFLFFTNCRLIHSLVILLANWQATIILVMASFYSSITSTTCSCNFSTYIIDRKFWIVNPKN